MEDVRKIKRLQTAKTAEQCGKKQSKITDDNYNKMKQKMAVVLLL